MNCSFSFRFVLEKKTSEGTKEKKMNGTIDENSNSSILSVDGKDETSPKRNAKRTAKDKVTKYGGSDDEEMENQENLNDSQSDFVVDDDSDSEKKVKKAKSKAKEQVKRERR